MKSRYKLIISSRNLYKEIQIEPNTEQITIGTGMECDVRLRKDMFFSPVELICTKSGEDWTIFCSDNLYFSIGDLRKLLTKSLKHGDSFSVKYQESDIDLFTVSFVIDFDYEVKDYNRKIYLDNKSRIKIGGTNDCDIVLKDQYMGTDSFLLCREADKFVVKEANVKYGTYINGIRDEHGEIRNKDFISVVGFSFYYDNDVLYTTGNNTVVVNGLRCEEINKQTSQMEYPKFNRNSRIKYVIPEEKIEIQQPSQRPKEQKKNLLMTLIPSLVMLGVTIVLRGVMGNGGTFVIYSVITMSMGIGMSVVTYIQDKKNYELEYKNRIENFNNYVDEKKKKIEKVREDELRVRNLMYESTVNSINEVHSFGKKVFERTVDDEDFLKVYLGVGRVESVNPVEYTTPEFVDLEDPLANVVEEVAESYRYIENAPIVADFKKSCAVGIVGAKNAQYQILKNITVDITARHFYSDVKMVYVLDFEDAEQFNWLKWLRNVDNDALNVKNIVCDEESQNLILENLYLILSERESLMSNSDKVLLGEHYIVFVLNSEEIRKHPVSRFIKNATSLNFTFVFFEEYEELLPQGCDEIIRLENEGNAVLVNVENGDAISTFGMPILTNEIVESTIMKLAPVYIDEVNLEGELTKNISMFELLGIISVDDLNLEERWNNSKVYKSMAAPLGVKNKNQVVSLDISDKSKGHGPHGLVAGTTGSGKSEILQTYILSMASLFHPYEVGFVIIDFKGGGMANQFTDLPHLIGAITNIDGREINRSLKSIKAEIIKRQEMFSNAGVNHINDYIKLFKENKVSVPMPHLIMIVDEFAELKAEHPDFMKELISAARIGRTLGVHLILATQKPAGVVDAQIWSNSKFKLCLKVQTKEDSNEVIKTPLAAEIVEPGRAYFQVGNNEIFELFQSAYSGADVPEGADANEVVVDIYEENMWGKKSLKYTNKRKKEKKDSLSQLQAIVDYVNNHCKQNNISRLPGICLPSLEDVINTDVFNEKAVDRLLMSVPIGIYDDPEQQRQDSVVLDLAKENVYIVGSSQTGKTVMLQTITYELMRRYTPQEANIYMVDCGSMVLKIFEDSKHVGGVVLSNEYEKCKNLFKLLNMIVVDRKKTLSALGIGNYSSYLEAGYSDMPLVVVMIDNMAAFKEYFPNEAEEISTLTREAQGVGISFIITAVSSNALNYRIQANFAKKIALNCNDTNEYNSLFGRCKETPKEIPGRGLCLVDKRVLEYQTAIFGQSKKEAERSQELVKCIEWRNNECTSRALQIPMIPEKLVITEVQKSNTQLFRQNCTLPIGMDFATVDYIMANLREDAMLALIGDTSNRIRFTKNLLQMFANNIVFHDVEAIVVDDKAKSLEQISSYGFVKTYTNDVEDALTYIDEFCDDVVIRKDHEMNMDCKLLIINNLDVLKRVYADKILGKRLADTMKDLSEANAFILYANIENQAVGFSASDVLKAIKDARKGILFAPLQENKVFEVSGRIKQENAFDSTMAYYFSNNKCTKIKLFD